MDLSYIDEEATEVREDDHYEQNVFHAEHSDFNGLCPNLLFKNKFTHNSQIDVHLWLAMFESINPGLQPRDMGLACVCLLDEAVLADIAQYLPPNYVYADVKRALHKAFDTGARNHIDHDNFLAMRMDSFDTFPQ